MKAQGHAAGCLEGVKAVEAVDPIHPIRRKIELLEEGEVAQPREIIDPVRMQFEPADKAERIRARHREN